MISFCAGPGYLVEVEGQRGVVWGSALYTKPRCSLHHSLGRLRGRDGPSTDSTHSALAGMSSGEPWGVTPEPDASCRDGAVTGDVLGLGLGLVALVVTRQPHWNVGYGLRGGYPGLVGRGQGAVGSGFTNGHVFAWELWGPCASLLRRACACCAPVFPGHSLFHGFFFFFVAIVLPPLLIVRFPFRAACGRAT